MKNSGLTLANENNAISARGLVGGTILVLGTAIATSFATQFVTGPTSVSALQTSVKTARANIKEIADKQDNVRERLTGLEGDVKDRYPGKQAREVNRHFRYRLNDLLRRVERLEAVCYGPK